MIRHTLYFILTVTFYSTPIIAMNPYLSPQGQQPLYQSAYLPQAQYPQAYPIFIAHVPPMLQAYCIVPHPRPEYPDIRHNSSITPEPTISAEYVNLIVPLYPHISTPYASRFNPYVPLRVRRKQARQELERLADNPNMHPVKERRKRAKPELKGCKKQTRLELDRLAKEYVKQNCPETFPVRRNQRTETTAQSIQQTIVEPVLPSPDQRNEPGQPPHAETSSINWDEIDKMSPWFLEEPNSLHFE